MKKSPIILLLLAYTMREAPRLVKPWSLHMFSAKQSAERHIFHSPLKEGRLFLTSILLRQLEKRAGSFTLVDFALLHGSFAW